MLCELVLSKVNIMKWDECIVLGLLSFRLIRSWLAFDPCSFSQPSHPTDVWWREPLTHLLFMFAVPNLSMPCALNGVTPCRERGDGNYKVNILSTGNVLERKSFVEGFYVQYQTFLRFPSGWALLDSMLFLSLYLGLVVHTLITSLKQLSAERRKAHF
jgi:hypothetical protein